MKQYEKIRIQVLKQKYITINYVHQSYKCACSIAIQIKAFTELQIQLILNSKSMILSLPINQPLQLGLHAVFNLQRRVKTLARVLETINYS